MRLLIVTQAVDTEDSALGFFHRWIEEFAKNCESVEVICLREGTHKLPANVRIHSLGKEGGRSIFKYITRFYGYVWSLRAQYDAVFVHMNPEYVVLGGLVWRALGKKVGLWYVHRSVQWWLKLASVFTNDIFTSAEKSINLNNRAKIHVMGHGVEVSSSEGRPTSTLKERPLILATLGRITRIKNLDVICRAVGLLKSKGIDSMLNIFGEEVTDDDRAYAQELKGLIKDLNIGDNVSFHGRIDHRDVTRTLAHCDISINASPTGGIDKVVLESLLSGTIPVTSNRSFSEIFGTATDQILFEESSPESLVERIQQLLIHEDLNGLRDGLKKSVLESSDVTKLIPRILSYYGTSR